MLKNLKLCIATLTHNSENRDKFLEYTIDSFASQYQDSIDWYIFCNGYSIDIENVVSNSIEKYSHINFIFKYSEVNLGCGAGINKLNEMIKQYEYVLFIEGDWILCPEDVSGYSINWLSDCVSFLDENKDVGEIFLRKYTSDYEHRQFGFGYWLQPSNVCNEIKYKDILLYELVNKKYSNNPALRRQSVFYSNNVFPLREYYSDDGNPLELKGNQEWGMAEIDAENKTKDIKTFYLSTGVYVHCDNWPYRNDWTKAREEINSCDMYNSKSISKCKYGFLLKNEMFCKQCIMEKNITDLAAHDGRYIESLNEN